MINVIALTQFAFLTLGIVFHVDAALSAYLLAGLFLAASTGFFSRSSPALSLSPTIGLKGFEDYYPSQISGGMQKRAGLARAMALDPEVLFFDEPSAGLDPISSRLLDDLILELRDSLGATVVVVTHELASIFTIGNNSVFLDPDAKTMTASGDPKELLAHCPDPKVQAFLRRQEIRRSHE